MDYKKKAILSIREIIDKELEAYMVNSRLDSIEDFKYNNWWTLVDDYIFEGLVEEIQKIVGIKWQNSLYVKQFVSIATDVLNIIRDNTIRDEYSTSYVNDWKFVYETIMYELEKHFGGRLKCHVNVYKITRHFGGHEEGGWWYDWYDCIDSKEVYVEHAEKVKEQLEKEYGEGEGDISSVLGGYEILVNIEHLEAESQSKEIPRYS